MVETVVVREVGLRDGLQLIQKPVPTVTKTEWCRAQAAAGFREIEVSSFVAPQLVPQLADVGEVLDAANVIPDLLASVLVPNLKGGVQAMERGARALNFVLSASNTHNQSNVGRTTDDSLVEFGDLIVERNTRGLKGSVHISAGIATAFGCSLEGDVPQENVLRIACRMVELGANEVMLADTVGYGNPRQVKRVFSDVKNHIGDIPILAHFHDTRAMGLANVVAALETDVRRFDSALGGLGGCPFAPGATGNIATEDCVYLLESLGLSTGVDFEGLVALRKKLPEWLPGEHMEGRLSQVGPAMNFRTTADKV